MKQDQIQDLAMEFIAENSCRITRKMIEILQSENTNELQELDQNMKRLIHNQAIYDYIKLVNFPKSIMTTDNPDFLVRYEKYAEKFRHTLSEMFESLHNWGLKEKGR